MRNEGGFIGVDIPSDDVITNCMHCGLCLPTCPTYSLTGREKSSPRGRIRLIKSVAEGKLGITEGFIDEMNFCLDCQACETACPAGVKYGSLVESARNQIRIAGKESPGERILKKFFFRRVFRNKSILKFLARMLRLYQQTGLERPVKKSGILRLLSRRLWQLQDLSPRISSQFFDESVPEILRPDGETKYHVGLLSGCLMNVAFAGINEDTVKVLLHHGCEVVIPREQVCCGSIQGHHGDFDTARQLAKKNVDAFFNKGLDAIIMNSSGCGAYMKEYGLLLQNDPVYSAKANAVATAVKDFSEFMCEIGLRHPDNEFPHRVTYHDACHLVHTQKISEQPRELIKSIPGIDYIELNEASWCCGSAGLYNVIRYDDSMNVLERKIHNLQATKAEYIVADNHGCLLQIEHGCRKYGTQTQVIHLASLLRAVYHL